ncbi:mechanosensitive ion channel family protein [Parahaliea aestuarii]|uniref:Small-conductance mechanosensitive channel n=1 Tax=Parahaliea aestuarii TaxID=1852021 RepID=A0A5C8ZQ53_9GAMM|nr:mechanosensitive ion channel domain-containing protein [Parahaliea aestuarii]TXS89934.1 mechanosensitive ion channel [Parahaliea aestuarii]
MAETESPITPAELVDTLPEVHSLLAFFSRLDAADPLIRLAIAGAIAGLSFLLLLTCRFLISRRLHGMAGMPETSFSPLRWQAQDLVTAEEMKQFWMNVWRGLSWVLSLIFGVATLIGLLLTSEWTMSLAAHLMVMVLHALLYVWNGFVGYLPNLATVIVILVVARYTVRTIGLIFEGIASRRIYLRNFYPEWAHTSFGIIRLLIYALTAVIIFPYLPGSSSPAFQGISIFVGVLISLGSTTAVANVVAGVVLTYTRAFQIGDQVELGDVRGRIVERSTFVTRIQTLKNVTVSIPNSLVLNSNVVNYSKNLGQSGILVHTGITIGYDVPWQTVNALLLAAAQHTEHISAHPEPFVLQLSLEDNYVSYEVNGWTLKPELLPRIYSELHANILDEFHGHQVEITSPAYRSVRDGNPLTVPQVLPREASGGVTSVEDGNAVG